MTAVFKLPPRPMHDIINEVAAKYGLTYAEIVSPRRQRALAWARQEAYWRCAKETTFTYPAIGRAFGDRDHSTIIKGMAAFEKRRAAETASGDIRDGAP